MHRNCAISSFFSKLKSVAFKGRLQQVLWWAAIVAPAAWLVWIILKFAVPTPYWDQIDFVPLLEKMDRGRVTFGDLWAQHNEHRIFFPTVVMLGLARVSGWNIAYELAANLLICGALFAVLFWQVEITTKAVGKVALKWCVPIASVTVFSLSQFQNWLWGWQISMFLNVFSVITGIVLLANPPFKWGKLAGAGLLGIVATFSFANGLLFWFIGAVVLVLATESAQRVKALVTWGLITLFAISAFFWDYHGITYHPSLALIVDSCFYILTYLGNVCAQHYVVEDALLAPLLGLAGFVGVCLLSSTLLRRRLADRQVLLPYAALALYSILSAVITAIGRGRYGSDQALSGRYSTMGVPLWFSLCCMLMLLVCAEKATEDHRRVAKWLVLMSVFTVLLSSALGVRGAMAMSDSLVRFRQSLLRIAADTATEEDWALMPKSIPHEAIVQRCAFLAKHNLSIFRNQQPVRKAVISIAGHERHLETTKPDQTMM